MDRIIARATYTIRPKKCLTLQFSLQAKAKSDGKNTRLNYFYNHSFSPCVLQVPETLRDTKPEAYAPQIVGLGPYHHFRAEVQQMERKKRAAVISYLKGKNISNLFEICPEIFEPTIRSCYDGYLDLDSETLAWVVIVGCLFLLHFMSTYLGECEEKKQNIHSNIEALVPDIMMLENQIPIILMRQMRLFLDKSCDVASDSAIEKNIHEFCIKQSPLQFTMDEGTKKGALDQKNHMLHYMYQMIVKNQSQTDGKDSQGRKDGGSSQGQTDSNSRIGELAKEIGVVAGEILEQAIEEYYTALAYAKSARLKVPGNVEKVSNILRNLQKTVQLDHMKGSLC